MSISPKTADISTILRNSQLDLQVKRETLSGLPGERISMLFSSITASTFATPGLPLSVENRSLLTGRIQTMNHLKRTLVYPNKEIKTGYFLNNMTPGKGLFIFDNRQTYQGDLSNNTLSGKGKLTYPNGSIYEGDFLNNSETGQGKLTHPDGRTYTGSFLNNTKHGKGRLTYSNGRIYEGDFLNNEPTGQGKLTGPNERSKEGLFENGKLIRGILTYPYLNASSEREGVHEEFYERSAQGMGIRRAVPQGLSDED